MIKSKFKCICSTITVGSMTDDLGLVFKPFNSTIMDRDLEVAEDVLLVAPDHPREVSHEL